MPKIKRVLTVPFRTFALQEAAYAANATGRVVDLLARLLEKRLKTTLYPFGGKNFAQHFRKGDSEGIGYLFFIGDKFPLRTIRINFEFVKTNKDSENKVVNSAVTSIDIWNSYQYNSPSYTVTLPRSANSVEMVGLLSKIISSPTVGNFPVAEGVDEAMENFTMMPLLNEAKKSVSPTYFLVKAAEIFGKKEKYTGKEILQTSNKFDLMVPANVWNDRSTDRVYPVISVAPAVAPSTTPEKKADTTVAPSAPTENSVVVAKGQPEKIIPSTTEQKVIAGGGVEELFSDLENLTQTVVNGTIPSLVVSGGPGLGKSTVIMNVIKSSGLKDDEQHRNFVVIKGSVTDISLYETLFYYRNSLIVLDDSDNIFDSKTGINLLKAALDSSGVRKISWKSRSTKNVSGMSRQQRLTYYDLLDAEFFGDTATPSSGAKVKFGSPNIPTSPINDPDEEVDSGEDETEITPDSPAAKQVAELDDDLKLPSEFEFKGKVIFITNLSKDDLMKKGMSAVISRGLFVELAFGPKEIFQRIKNILPKIMLTDGEGKNHNVHETAKVEVYNFLVREYKAGRMPQVSIRSYVSLLKVRASGNPQWQRMLKYVQV